MKEIAEKGQIILNLSAFRYLIGYFYQHSYAAKCKKQSKFWSILHSHEESFAKHGLFMQVKDFAVVLRVFCKGNDDVQCFLFH